MDQSTQPSHIIYEKEAAIEINYSSLEEGMHMINCLCFLIRFNREHREGGLIWLFKKFQNAIFKEILKNLFKRLFL